MRKTVFNAKVIAEIVNKCNSLLQESFFFQIEEDNETNVMMTVTDDRKKIVYSPRICNHPEMNESAVYSYILHICSAFHTVENNALSWDRLEACAKELSKKLEIEPMNYYEIESHVRKIRRIIFPDPKNGGCYFKIGQLLHRTDGRNRGKIYRITNISPLTDKGIFITCTPRFRKDPEPPLVHEEEYVFNNYILVEICRRADD